MHDRAVPGTGIGTDRARRGKEGLMAQRRRGVVAGVAMLVLLAGVLVASPAYALRLRGVALSDSGIYVSLVVRVHQVAAGLVGNVRCIAGSAPCLFGRARVSVTFAPDGSFTGGLLSGNGRTQCAVAGVLAGGGLEGRYECLRNDGAGDVGSFQVTP